MHEQVFVLVSLLYIFFITFQSFKFWLFFQPLVSTAKNRSKFCYVVTEGDQLFNVNNVNVRWDERLESCLMPALFSVVATLPIRKQVSGCIKFHTIYPLFFFSSFSSRPYAYESANGLYSMEPRSHKCSVMGHKRRNFNQS